MADKNSLFTCVCGHEFVDHYSKNDVNFNIVGYRFCMVTTKGEALQLDQYIDTCRDYRPDNLKYLEDQACDRS